MHRKTYDEFHTGKTSLEIVFWEKGPSGRGRTQSPIGAKLLGATLGVPVFKNEVPNGSQAAEYLLFGHTYGPLDQITIYI